MNDEGVRHYHRAKEKACQRLGVSVRNQFPTNLEVEDALAKQISIFESDKARADKLRYLQTAHVMMQLLHDFIPKLTGAALSGVIASPRPVEIHVFAPTYEEVCATLSGSQQNYNHIERRKRFAKKRFETIPGFELLFNDCDVEILCFLKGDPYPPLSQTSGQAIHTASLKKVRRMLN